MGQIVPLHILTGHEMGDGLLVVHESAGAAQFWIIIYPRVGGAICLEIEVVDDIIGGDGCEPLCRKGDVIGRGVLDAVEERHELEEGGSVWFRSGGGHGFCSS